MPTIRFYHSETGWPYECAHKLKYDKDACVCVCLCLWENAHGCVDVWMYYVYINICHPSSIIFVMEVRGRRTQCWMKRWETKDVLSPWTHLFLFFSFPPFKWSEWFFISVFPQVMPCFKEKKRKECAEKSAFLFDIPKLPEWCHHVALCAISRS